MRPISIYSRRKVIQKVKAFRRSSVIYLSTTPSPAERKVEEIPGKSLTRPFSASIPSQLNGSLERKPKCQRNSRRSSDEETNEVILGGWLMLMSK